MRNFMNRSGRLRPGSIALLTAAALSLGFTQGYAQLVRSVADEGVAATDTDNDFTRIQNALNTAANGATITLQGTFDFSEANALADYVAAGRAVKPKAAPAQTNLTLTAAAPGAATLRIDKGTVGYDSFLFTENRTLSGWTISNLIFDGFDLPLYLTGNHTNLTIANNEFRLGVYNADGTVFGIYAAGAKTNLSILDNNFAVTPNGLDPGQPGDGERIIASFFHCCSTTAYDNTLVDGNEYYLVPRPGTTAPYYVSSQISFMYDNNNTNSTANPATASFDAINNDVTFSNNVFDGALPRGGDSTAQKIALYGLITNHRQGYLQPSPNAVAGEGEGIIAGNTFRNIAGAIYSFATKPDAPADALDLRANTFINVGYLNTTTPFTVASGASDAAVRISENYIAGIRNFTSANYGDWGPKKTFFHLDNEVDGVTGIPMLNYVAERPEFFEVLKDDILAGTLSQAGILAVQGKPDAVTTYNNPAWTGQNRFTRPTPEQDGAAVDLSAVQLALGYNAFGDAIDEGNPNFIADNPTNPLVIDISADTEFPVGTRINKDVTIRLSPAAPAGSVFSLFPKTKNLASPLFIVEPGGSLTIQNLTLDGDSPAAVGSRDILSFFRLRDEVSGNDANLILENVIARQCAFFAIEAGKASDVTISDSTIRDMASALRADATSTVVISNTKFVNLAAEALNNLGANTNLTLTRNVFDNVRRFMFIVTGTGTTLNAGGAGNGNLFITPTNIMFNGVATITNVNMVNNWHSNIWAGGADESNGIITGNADAFDSATDVVAGVRTYRTTPSFNETSFIAQFDRDADGLPDAWEIGGSTDYQNFDTDGDGWPDGLEVALGTNPNNSASFPAGTFDINANTTGDSRYADWYEFALATNLGIEPFLGKVLRRDMIGLSEAVRALQVVNGVFPNRNQAADMNALDVTGRGPNSLANPLQILRFQAGVREKLPAVPGVN